MPYINRCDPDHSTPATKEKVANNMGGFVSFENAKGHKNKNYCDVMRTFTPEKLPVLTTLAKEFAIMDEFFLLSSWSNLAKPDVLSLWHFSRFN